MSNKNRGKKSLQKYNAMHHSHKDRLHGHKEIARQPRSTLGSNKHKHSISTRNTHYIGNDQHRQSRLESILQKVPLYPVIVGIIGIILVSLMFYSQMAPVGYSVLDASGSAYCLKEGRDGAAYKVSEKGECCFLITNTDRCRQVPAENMAYKDLVAQGNAGTFTYKYECYGGSTRDVKFATTVKNYCDVQI